MKEENIEHKVDVTFTTGEATNEYLNNKIIPIIMTSMVRWNQTMKVWLLIYWMKEYCL